MSLVSFVAVCAFLLFAWKKKSEIEHRDSALRFHHTFLRTESGYSGVSVNFENMTIVFESAYYDFPAWRTHLECDLRYGGSSSEEWQYRERRVLSDEVTSSEQILFPSDYYQARLDEIADSSLLLHEDSRIELRENLRDVDKWKGIEDPEFASILDDRYQNMVSGVGESVFDAMQRKKIRSAG